MMLIALDEITEIDQQTLATRSIEPYLGNMLCSSPPMLGHKTVAKHHVGGAMFRSMLCFLLLFIASFSVRSEANLEPRIFFGLLDSHPIVMRLDFGTLVDEKILPKPLPLDFVNVQGDYFFIEQEVPIKKLVHGRWEKTPGTLRLEEYRLQIDEDGEGASRKEQTGFFDGKIVEIKESVAGGGSSYQLRGDWIETSSLSHYAFSQGNPYLSKRRASFELFEGGKNSIQEVTGAFTCNRKSPGYSQELAFEINEGNLVSFMLKTPHCTLDQTMGAQYRRDREVILKVDSSANQSKCVVSISSLGEDLLVSTGPITCFCGGPVLLNRKTYTCHP